MKPLIAICSPRPRPSVQKGAKGNQWWSRDVYHLRADDGHTLCGRDCAEWLVIGPIESLDADCCELCARKSGSAQ